MTAGRVVLRARRARPFFGRHPWVYAGAIDSINQLKMTSFELNKIWRLKPYHNGTILEPIVGYRYFKTKDWL